MQLQICLISSLLSICSAQQVPNWLGRVFHNPFRIDVIRRNPVPPPAAPTQHRTAPATSPCPDGCDTGYVCFGGGCQKTGDSLCSPMCEESHTCHHGHCHYEPCRPSCRNGERCINGRCESVPCRPRCQAGSVCVRGQCERDMGGVCEPPCPPGYRCHDGHCDSEHSSPHETCDPACPPGYKCHDSHCDPDHTTTSTTCDEHRPCPPNSRCVDGHCTGEALTVGAVSPTDVRSVNPGQAAPSLPFNPAGPISPLIPGAQPGPFSPGIPNSQTNFMTPNDPNSRWLVRDSSGSRIPWARPPPTLIRPGSNLPDNTITAGASGPVDLNPVPNAVDLFPMTNSFPPRPQQPSSNRPSGIGIGSSPLSGSSQIGTGMSLPPLTSLISPPGTHPVSPGAQMPPAGPPQVPAQGQGNGGIFIPDIAEICQGGNCNGAPLAPGSNVGLLNQRTAAAPQMVGRGDNCGELTCFENEFCFDPITSTCIGVNTGDPRVP
uniref:Tenascin-X-like isoform X3 n=1 Tax=Crassostrea virginica TaxID=6565 RepID=A0A8B8D043_CRAVI|nr:tenascin-X-like isoform X3 [Crassostrea virginica]